MRTVKAAAILAVGTLTLGLAACGGSGNDEAASGQGESTGGDNYVLAYGTEPQNPLIPVSYTHLTLPTICSV